uniref:F-box domain-containing protein n=1 Tax=Clastoptera arizonana TaxID=38151 RepID=A0A1B6DS35_9HEMI
MSNTTQTHILHLPEEVLVYIFSFLAFDEVDTLKLVCWRFYHVGNVALNNGLLWIRRNTLKLLTAPESDYEEYYTTTKIKRPRRGTRRSKLMQMTWCFRRYQSFIVIVCLSQLFISAFFRLISDQVYPTCCGRIIQLYFKTLMKISEKPCFVARSLQKSIYTNTLKYYSLCEFHLKTTTDFNMNTVLNTFLEVLECFPLKDVHVTSGVRNTLYHYSLPGCWLDINRSNKQAATCLTTEELLSILSCLYSTAASCLAKFAEAEYLLDGIEVTHQQWPRHTIYIGTTHDLYTLAPLVFEFSVPHSNNPVRMKLFQNEVQSNRFFLKITSLDNYSEVTTLTYSYQSVTARLKNRTLKRFESSSQPDGTLVKRARLF